MRASALPQRFVAVLQVPDGTRLFCSDQFRDEWTSRLGYAETFLALHEALPVAQRHGGQVLSWQEACAVAI
jgi:hypothetical protein